MIMESPAVWLMILLFLLGPSEKSIPAWIMLGLFELHYVHRTLIFPFRTRTSGKKMPLLIAASAFFFQLVNVGFNGYALGWHADRYGDEWLHDPRFITGVLLFLVGWGINYWADDKLIHLRKPGETGYKIPRGGLFEYVSCPNFLGEVIEWAGWALLCWNLEGLSFWLWTAANLLPRAWSHHRWYREKFADYPAGRKIILPGLW
jgi:protein-S-isoprenylcysteine O-methyltransferase Ste14